MIKKIFFFSQSLIFCERKIKVIDLLKKPINSLICPEWPERIAHIHSFVMSDICHERSKQFPHSRSFVLSDLSKSLTFAHLSWAILANAQMSNEQIPNPENSGRRTLLSLLKRQKIKM